MLLERIEDHGLSQYSYVIGCEGAGVAAVVDPRRDVDVYLDWAAARDLRIAHVLETHIHADFASGARELAARTGAELGISAYDAGELYEVSFAHREIHDRDRLALGAVVLEARHTPGHTPEHLSFLVFDGARSSTVPMVLLSGDFLFVGSLGRPDLLGEDAKRGLARRLFRSVREQLSDLPDGLEIAPGHGAGSMCGAGMSGRATSTLGFERLANPYLDPALDEARFVERILANVPPFPDYYRRMKVLNARGPALLTDLPGQTAVPIAEFRRLVEAGHVVIDVRDQLGFGAGHVPGALGIGAGTSVSTWAAWVVPYETPLLLVVADARQASETARALVRVGLDDVGGFLEGGMDAWIASGAPIAQTPQWSVRTLAQRLETMPDRLRLVDVRSAGEYAAGHVAESQHVMGGHVVGHADDWRDASITTALICRTGYRSTVAASALARAGVESVVNVTGGLRAWTEAGLPVVSATS